MTEEIVAIASSFTAIVTPYLPKILGKISDGAIKGFDKFMEAGGEKILKKIFPENAEKPSALTTVAEQIHEKVLDQNAINLLAKKIGEKLATEGSLVNEVKEFLVQANSTLPANSSPVTYNNTAEKIITITNSTGFTIHM